MKSVLRKTMITSVAIGMALAAYSGQAAEREIPGATMEDYAWWQEARFGIFIHWGPGALVHRNSLTWERPPEGRPHWRDLGFAATEDLSKIPPEIYNGGYTNYTKGGPIPADIYVHLNRIFDPVAFDADEVAQMAVDAGAGYVVFTTKHHDGFSMWDSAFTDYDMMSTPSKRDVAKELAEALQKRDIKLLWYYSKVDYYDARHDVKNPEPYDDFFYNQIEELLTKYGPIKGMWWDGGSIRTDNERLFKMMHKHQPGLLTNGRVGKVPYGVSFGSPEQRVGSFNMDRPWESCAVTHGHSWIWNGGKDIKSVNTCLQMLVGCAVGDGNLLLNYGPKPDGSIDPDIKKIFHGIGDYLKKYGESIYGTRGGPYMPGSWGGSTRKGDTIYLHVTQRWPGGVLELPPLPAKVRSAKALTGGTPRFTQTDDGLVIRLDAKHHHDVDTIIALTIDREAMEVDPIPVREYPTMTMDARVTASSSENANSKRGAAETVLPYSFETGKLTRNFGEESDDLDEANHQVTHVGDFSDEEWARLKKIISGHRGSFWRYWRARAEDPKPWIEVDLGRPVTFQRLGLVELYGTARGYEVQQREDGEWKTFYEGDRMDGLSLLLPEPLTTDGIRVVLHGNNGDHAALTKIDLYER